MNSQAMQTSVMLQCMNRKGIFVINIATPSASWTQGRLAALSFLGDGTFHIVARDIFESSPFRAARAGRITRSSVLLLILHRKLALCSAKGGFTLPVLSPLFQNA